MTKTLPMLAILLLLAGCIRTDANIRETARCDGSLNSTEETVDDAFDADGDGYFDADNPNCQDTYGPDELDCDEEDPNVNPGVAETFCNDIDDDCDPDSLDAPDSDNDGFTPCEGDCDDNQALAAPGLPEEACDGIDNDCIDTTLDGPDVDQDGWTACDDCLDDDPNVNPSVTEVVCNGLDDDCNDQTLDGDDFDNDGFIHCFDCDDNDPLRYPGATEICEDGIDQNCTGSDEDCAPPTWDGLWSTNQVNYSCASNQVVFDFNAVSVVDTNPNISFTFVGNGNSPGTTSGTLGSGDTFTSTLFIGGLCDEQYDFDGSFTSGTTFSGTLTATFTDNSGTGFGCIDCTNQTWNLTGTR